jgi:diguanylate cyclase
MNRQRSAGDIARQTLRELAVRKLEPTPDNYHHLYQQIAGDTPTTIPPREWAGVIRTLVRNSCEGSCTDSSVHRWSALELALSAADDAHKLKRRLDALAADWEAGRNSATASASATHHGKGNTAAARETPATAPARLYELLAHALESGIAAQLIHAPALAAEAGELAARLREHLGDAPRAPRAADLETLHPRLKALWIKVAAQDNRQSQLQTALLELLHLMIDNVGELVADDQWLRGQMNVVMQAISTPLDICALTQAKANLTEVIRKQSELKQGLAQVRTSLKEMVVSFIGELGKLSATTGDYHDSVEHLSQKIRQTDDVNQLNLLIEEVLRETRDVQTCTLRSRQEVLAARHRVDEAERKVAQLEAELQQVSEKVQTDYLTGTLNRRGLKDAFDRELAVSERENTPVSIALLDIDNFKDLNDNFGHQVGDNILVHLAELIKETVRPGDSVARYGGEEFLILLPNADLAQASTVLTRLQRALTKHFFLHDNCKVLITFSTGVTRRLPGESQEAVIARADAALYQAKNGGKNRVVAVEAGGDGWQPDAAVAAMPVASAGLHASI